MRITVELIEQVERKFNAHVVAITTKKIALKRHACAFHRHCYMTTNVDVHHAHKGKYSFHRSTFDLTIDGASANMGVVL